MTTNNEIRIQMIDVGNKKYTTNDLFALAFSLDFCSVIEVVEDLIEEDVSGHKDMFIETSYELDNETFKAYYISPNGIIKLAREFDRDVQPKSEINLDKMLDDAIKTRLECEQINQDVKKQSEEIRRLFGRILD